MAAINPQNVNLTVLFNCKPGMANELAQLLVTLTTETRKESACIQYDLHRSVEDHNLFILHEQWADQNGLDLHNTQPHIKTFITASASLMQVPAQIIKTTQLL